MSVPRLSKGGGKTWREGESTRLSAWWWALRRLVAFRAMHGGGQSENLVPSKLSRTHLCPDLTPACPNGKGIVATSGEAASGERLPRVGLQHSASSARNRGGKERLEAHQRKRNQFLPAPSIPPSPSIQQMCEKSKKRHGKGDLLLSISKGWIETIDMLAETFVQRPLPSPGQAASLGESRDMPDFNFQFWKHLLPLACGCNPARTPQRKAASPVGVLLLFVNIPCLPKDGRSRHGPLSSCHDFTTSPDRP